MVRYSLFTTAFASLAMTLVPLQPVLANQHFESLNPWIIFNPSYSTPPAPAPFVAPQPVIPEPVNPGPVIPEPVISSGTPVFPVPEPLSGMPVFSDPYGTSGTLATPIDFTVDTGDLSETTTDRIVAQLEAATLFCAAIVSREYRVDCLAERFEVVAATIPQTGDYADARAAIAQASRSLGALVDANPSATLPAGIARSLGDDGESSRPLRPTETARLAQTMEQATSIIEEAETVLLRSGENSQRRQVHYQRIAAAIGSNKVLLRST